MRMRGSMRSLGSIFLSKSTVCVWADSLAVAAFDVNYLQKYVVEVV